tara:strand:- start:67 stop:438 length:372 start_codon:yes stop_codon:yes gene_type:complete
MTIDEFDTYTMSYQNMTSNVLLPQVCVFLDIDPKIAQERVKQRMETQTGRKCENVIDIQYLSDLKKQQEHVVSTLKSQGVYIIHIQWEKNRSNDEITEVAKTVAAEINNLPQRSFLDFHKRTI